MSSLIKVEYTVVSTYGTEAKFVQTVQAMIDEGWVLQGGVSVCKDGSQSRHCQALIKTKSVLMHRPVIDEELVEPLDQS